MGINLGDVFPDFSADSSQGPLKWHTYIDGSWSILFSHPADYTPVCTTELGTVASYEEEFTKRCFLGLSMMIELRGTLPQIRHARRGVKLAALSCNDAESHKGWIKDIESTKFAHSSKVSYPIVCDPKRELAVKFGMLDPDEKDAAGLAMTARAVFIIGPDKKLKLSILYPATTGRNFDEILRVIDSLQLTAEHSVATPANWNHGDKCMVVPSLSDEDAKKKLGSFVTTEVPSGKKYIRMTDDPSVKSGPVHTLLTPVRLLGGGLKNVGNLLARE